MQLLLNTGSDVNIVNEDGVSCAHLCARYNLHTLLNEIVNNEGQVDMEDDLGRTPLHIAAVHSSQACVTALLAASAEPSALAHEPLVTPLYCAAMAGDVEICLKLLNTPCTVMGNFVGSIDEGEIQLIHVMAFEMGYSLMSCH